MAAMDVKEELDTRMATACPCQSVEAWIQECIKTNSFMDPSTNALRDVLQHDMEIIFQKYGGPPQFLEAALTDLEQKGKTCFVSRPPAWGGDKHLGWGWPHFGDKGHHTFPRKKFVS